MPKRKLYNGPVIDIDPQIIRWRRYHKKKGALANSGGDGKPGPKKGAKPKTAAEKELEAILKFRR